MPTAAAIDRPGLLTGTTSERVLFTDLSDNRIRMLASCPLILHGNTSLPAWSDYPLFSVSTPEYCPWTLYSNAEWLRLDRSAGYGAATVRAEVWSNMGLPRTAILTLNGQPNVISQSGACSATVTPASVSATGNGRADVLTLSINGSECAWTASSSASWIELYPLGGTTSGTVSYTIYPNFGSAPRTGKVTVAGKEIMFAQAAGSGTQNERFVKLLYFSFFGRLPSPSELAFHVNSGIPRAQVVQNFFNSDEFNLGGRYVAGLYVGVLDRDAEFGGWQFQRNAAGGGKITQLQLVTNFMSSQEYSLRFGNPDAVSFIRLLYRKILLREASLDEIQIHFTGLSNGSVSRPELARRFLNSSEFRVGTEPRLTSFLLHAALLLRESTAPEHLTAMTKINGGISLSALIQEILQGTEFTSLLN